MTPESAPTGARKRDANASRERLLAAATELFADRGFDRTTARDIGERAGVDAALIARYFGGKAQLYVATLHADSADIPADFLDPARMAELLARTDGQGPGPVFQTAIRPYDDAAAQQAAVAELQRRIVAPVRDRLAAAGHAAPDLRAELLTAAFIGVVLARRAGALTTLAVADPEQLIAELQSVFRSDSARAVRAPR